MKIVATFIMVLVLAKGCSTSELQKESDKISFEYEAMTRGSYKKVIAKQDTIFTIKNRSGETQQSKLSKGDWDQMLSLLSKVDVATIKDLKAPSEKRFHDGAMMANLKIIHGDKTYESATFDHGNPPAAIEKLVNKIIQVSDLEKE